MAKYKTKCGRCKKNYVLAIWKTFPICYECQKPDLEGEIKDSKMKKFFNIEEELYKQSMFLRDIKIKYLRYGELSEKQIEAFKKTVDKMKEEQKSTEKLFK